MNARTVNMHRLARSAVALLLGAALPLAAARAQPAGPGSSGSPTTAHHKLPPTTHMPHSVAAQNRELNQIGNKLLKETPNKPVNSTASEGGGLEPPTH